MFKGQSNGRRRHLVALLLRTSTHESVEVVHILITIDNMYK